MRKLIAALAVVMLVAGCDWTDGEVKPFDSYINWTYMEGPNGERCLFATAGNGNNGMSCDTINWPEED